MSDPKFQLPNNNYNTTYKLEFAAHSIQIYKGVKKFANYSVQMMSNEIWTNAVNGNLRSNSGKIADTSHSLEGTNIMENNNKNMDYAICAYSVFKHISLLLISSDR